MADPLVGAVVVLLPPGGALPRATKAIWTREMVSGGGGVHIVCLTGDKLMCGECVWMIE